MLKKLKKYLKSEIFDIVIYGSSVKGKLKPGDLDVLIIFNSGNLRERLDYLSVVKKKIEVKNLDLKQILLTDLFKPEFFGRTGIFLEGHSVRENKPFSELLGFKGYTLFWWNLKKLNHTEKVRFNYILAGRNQKGIIEEFNGERLVNGAVKIPITNSLEFGDILIKNKVDFKKKNILESI